jgi:hypothetical protein
LPAFGRLCRCACRAHLKSAPDLHQALEAAVSSYLEPFNTESMMKKLITVVALAFAASTAFAQATTAVKEAGKATAETAKQGTENMKSATTKEPSSTMHSAKAGVHKAKAKRHGHKAKAAAKEAVK